MNDRDALLAAILVHPDEDTPRLAFADYLDEHGDTHGPAGRAGSSPGAGPGPCGDRDYAAFIRKQIELIDVPEWDPRWIRAWYEARDTLTGRGLDTRRPDLPTGLSWPTLETFRRGFPWHVQTVEVAPFLDAADALVRAMPLQALTVKADTSTYRDPFKLAPLLASPHLARIRRLTFSLCRFTPDTARALCACPHLTELRELVLNLTTLDPGATAELLRSPLVERLEELRFDGSIQPLGEVVAALNAAGGPHRLRRFHFTPFNNSILRPDLLTAPLLRGLRELEVNKCEMGGPRMNNLFASQAVRELESLTLVGAAPGVPGVKALAACAALTNLRRLKLADNRLGPVAAKALAASPHLTGLRVLDLGSNPLGDKGAIELARAPWLKNLVHLGVSRCDIGDAGAEALAAALDPNTLLRLEMWSSHRTGVSEPVRQKLKARFGNRVSV